MAQVVYRRIMASVGGGKTAPARAGTERGAAGGMSATAWTRKRKAETAKGKEYVKQGENDTGNNT